MTKRWTSSMNQEQRLAWVRASVCLGCREPWPRNEFEEETFDLSATKTRWYHTRCADSFGVQQDRNVASGLQPALFAAVR